MKDLGVRARKEVWFSWMKTYWLNNTFSLWERSCGCTPAQAVDHHLAWSLNIVSHRCKIISFHVPYYFTYNMLKLHFYLQFSLIRIVIKLPLHKFFFLIIRLNINIIFQLPLLKKIWSLLWKRFTIKLGLNNIN